MMEPKKGKFVTPGEVLCTEEEFLPTRSVFTENGNVYSAMCGNVETKDGRVLVSNSKAEVDKIGRGMLVLGEVVSEVGKVLFVKIDDVKAGNKLYAALSDGKIITSSHSGPRDRSGPHGPAGKICKEGDVILAKVDEVGDDIYTLGLYGPETGVVYARCSECGGDMRYDDTERVLVCTKCKHREHARVSALYGKPNEIKSLLAKAITQPQ